MSLPPNTDYLYHLFSKPSLRHLIISAVLIFFCFYNNLRYTLVVICLKFLHKLEVGGGMLTEGADKIFGEVFAVVLVAADPTFPDLLIRFIGGGLRLYVCVIVGIGRRRDIG